jgi:hypothetical protein
MVEEAAGFLGEPIRQIVTAVTEAPVRVCDPRAATKMWRALEGAMSNVAEIEAVLFKQVGGGWVFQARMPSVPEGAPFLSQRCLRGPAQVCGVPRERSRSNSESNALSNAVVPA